MLIIVIVCTWVADQDLKCIQLVNPAREHVTNTDGKIQTWWPDGNFTNMEE